MTRHNRTARNREINYRHNIGRNRALRRLADRHPDEYRELLREEKRRLLVERGPLPPRDGDRPGWAYGDPSKVA